MNVFFNFTRIINRCLYNMHQPTAKVHTHQHLYIHLYLPMPFLYTFFYGLKIQTHTLNVMKKIEFMALLKMLGVLPLALMQPGFPL